nr:hypothetical protein [Aminicella lysinilytica]
MISLSVGVILFVALGGLVGQSEGIQDYMKININETVISDYSSGYTEKTNKTTGRNEIKYLKPIDSRLCDKVAEKLSDYGDTEVFGMGTDLDTYYTEVQNSLINADIRSQLKSRKDRSEMSVEIITLDIKNYAKICKAAGVPAGSAILLMLIGLTNVISTLSDQRHDARTGICRSAERRHDAGKPQIHAQLREYTLFTESPGYRHTSGSGHYRSHQPAHPVHVPGVLHTAVALADPMRPGGFPDHLGHRPLRRP